MLLDDAHDLKAALMEDMEETGLPWLSSAISGARPELLEDALFLVFGERDRYAFHRACASLRELGAAMATIAPELRVRVHRQAEAELYGL